MNMATQHNVLQDYLQEWLKTKGDKEKRGKLTKKLSSTLKMHEKSIPRAMRRLQLRRSSEVVRTGRPRTYGAEVDAALAQVWELMGYPCAEHMTRDAIDEHIAGCVQEKEWCFSDTTTDLLLVMSEGTKKDRIRGMRAKRGMTRGRSATTPSPLKGMIPIRKSHTWQELGTGFLQTDTVVHCGDRLTDDVVYSLGCVDFRTYWSEYTAQWNKGQEATRASLEVVVARMPFGVREVHPDTGNEYINHHVYRWIIERGIDMTRSEPYKKNDNMCIEERNNAIPRTEVGYARLDDPSLVSLVSELLELVCTYRNHFRPVRRMLSKVRVGARWKYTYERVARTPYERVLAQDDVPEVVKEQLRTKHAALNPVVLRREIVRIQTELARRIRAQRITK